MNTTDEVNKQIEHARKTATTPEQALDLVIRLYGEQFFKANTEITLLKQANREWQKAVEDCHRVISQKNDQLTVAKRENDELFKLKQKVVIANRELMQRLAAKEAQ
jgi:hypothetical protein